MDSSTSTSTPSIIHHKSGENTKEKRMNRNDACDWNSNFAIKDMDANLWVILHGAFSTPTFFHRSHIQMICFGQAFIRGQAESMTIACSWVKPSRGPLLLIQSSAWLPCLSWWKSASSQTHLLRVESKCLLFIMDFPRHIEVKFDAIGYCIELRF